MEIYNDYKELLETAEGDALYSAAFESGKKEGKVEAIEEAMEAISYLWINQESQDEVLNRLKILKEVFEESE